MKLKVFAIYDSKVQAYLPPVTFKTIGEAERILGDCVNNENHDFCKHSQDYTLFQLGEWDDSSSVYDVFDAPQHICLLSELSAAVK